MNDDFKEFVDILFAPRERDELRNRINKAIEYIENNINELKEEHLFIEFTKEELYTLLDILKGEDIK